MVTDTERIDYLEAALESSEYEFDDFELVAYDPHPRIIAPVAV